MDSPIETRSEKYLRFSRRGMTVALLLIVAVGGVSVAMAIWPAAPTWPAAIPSLWIVAIVLAAGLQRTLGGDRWSPRAPEVQAIANDEWRRINMDRARRVAFLVVLAAQIPLGLLLVGLPSHRAVMAMAASTITLGLATLIAIFLHLDRDLPDAA
jgi:hypothetical protein